MSAPPAVGKPTGPITIGASLSLTGTAANDFSADGQAFEKGVLTVGRVALYSAQQFAMMVA